MRFLAFLAALALASPAFAEPFTLTLSTVACQPTRNLDAVGPFTEVTTTFQCTINEKDAFCGPSVGSAEVDEDGDLVLKLLNPEKKVASVFIIDPAKFVAEIVDLGSPEKKGLLCAGTVERNGAKPAVKPTVKIPVTEI